jgi:shikimate dehydrogenase
MNAPVPTPHAHAQGPSDAAARDPGAALPPPDRYAVLGNPVAHSRSPAIHAAFARATGEHLTYERVLCPLDGFADAVRAFADGGARGCNVTVPFKLEAPLLAGRLTPRARLAGAANTLRFDLAAEGGWLADNTDGVGLVRDIEANAGVALAGRRVLLIGAGGAGAGVLGPLLQARPAALVLANRTRDKADALAAAHAGWAAEHGVALGVAGLDAPGTEFDVVINASSSSLQGGAASPVPAGVLAPGALAVDLMYGPAAEPFVAWAAAHGAVGRDGLGMLVEQAAEAFFVWRGVRPPTAPVLAALRAELAT